MSFRKSFNVAGTTHRFDLRSKCSTSSTARVSETRSTNPTLADFGYITSQTGNRTMQIGLQYVF